MKPVFFIILFVMPVILFSQERQKIKRTVVMYGLKHHEKFQVLASDTSIKDGYYESETGNGTVVKGYYKNGKKDSVWTVMNGKICYSRKYFTNGERTGKWQFYSYDGTPEWAYDFDNNRAENARIKAPDTTDQYYQEPGGDWIWGKLDKTPISLNSQVEWLRFSFENLVKIASQGNQRVFIGFTVNENGEPSDFKTNSADTVLGKEAMRIVKAFGFECVPAEKDGHKVKAQTIVSIQVRRD